MKLYNNVFYANEYTYVDAREDIVYFDFLSFFPILCPNTTTLKVQLSWGAILLRGAVMDIVCR